MTGFSDYAQEAAHRILGDEPMEPTVLLDFLVDCYQRKDIADAALVSHAWGENRDLSEAVKLAYSVRGEQSRRALALRWIRDSLKPDQSNTPHLPYRCDGCHTSQHSEDCLFGRSMTWVESNKP